MCLGKQKQQPIFTIMSHIMSDDDYWILPPKQTYAHIRSASRYLGLSAGHQVEPAQHVHQGHLDLQLGQPYAHAAPGPHAEGQVHEGVPVDSDGDINLDNDFNS